MEPIHVRALFAMIMATFMVSLLTFVLVPVRQGFAPGAFGAWLDAWLVAWPVAVAAIYFLAPLSRRITAWMLARLG